MKMCLLHCRGCGGHVPSLLPSPSWECHGVGAAQARLSGGLVQGTGRPGPPSGISWHYQEESHCNGLLGHFLTPVCLSEHTWNCFLQPESHITEFVILDSGPFLGCSMSKANTLLWDLVLPQWLFAKAGPSISSSRPIFSKVCVSVCCV